MSNEQVQATSAWRDLQTPGTFKSADEFIAAAQASRQWPLALRTEKVLTESGLVAPGVATVASYPSGPDKALAINGTRYNGTAADDWREIMHAIVNAGGVPTGIHAFKKGAVVAASFQVGHDNGVRTNFVAVDSFDGSTELLYGDTSIKIGCWNSFVAFLRGDGHRAAKARHTASLEEKVKSMIAAIPVAIKHGIDAREALYRAEGTFLSRPDADRVFDQLFPRATDDSSQAAKTRADNNRSEATSAMLLPINNVGSTLGTVWNAATYLVDRRADGESRARKGGDTLASMLLGGAGSRRDRIEQIQTIVEVMMADGSVAPMTVTEAHHAGVDDGQIGSAILQDMLS